MEELTNKLNPNYMLLINIVLLAIGLFLMFDPTIGYYSESYKLYYSSIIIAILRIIFFKIEKSAGVLDEPWLKNNILLLIAVISYPEITDPSSAFIVFIPWWLFIGVIYIHIISAVIINYDKKFIKGKSN